MSSPKIQRVITIVGLCVLPSIDEELNIEFKLDGIQDVRVKYTVDERFRLLFRVCFQERVHSREQRPQYLSKKFDGLPSRYVHSRTCFTTLR
ncbi:hypothetical protein AVEN_164291-1 [Araneus ventricosus]|uniref:Uncharacterized protein n=1 Tax=Araneus ventricosus TaxID=182803 RepID=A0A4Y2GZ60_ARAVE|nr:hypothetical protein AVEN_164291-1 [Araneus ventricosus]